jgi:hypothetical protein
MSMIDTHGYQNTQWNFEDDRGMSSYAVIKDWQEWWRLWGPEIAKRFGHDGWVLFILEAHTKMEDILMNWSRILRNKPDWDTAGWSEDEWSNPLWVAAKAKAWFQTNCPHMDDIPEFARFILVGQNGMFGVLERLAREMFEIQSEGHLLVNMTNKDTGRIEPTVVEED